MSEITGHLIKMRLGDLDKVKSKEAKEVRTLYWTCISYMPSCYYFQHEEYTDDLIKI